MMAETSPIFGSNPSKPAQDPLFYDKADTPKTVNLITLSSCVNAKLKFFSQRALQIAFVSCVIIAVGVSKLLRGV